MTLMECDSKFSKYIDSSENTKLSELSNSAIIDYLSSLKLYYLGFRDRLFFDENITLGLEIEFENARRKAIESELATMYPDHRFSVVDDGSLLNGGEINSPVLVNTEENWIDLSKVCRVVSQNASVLDNVGAHVHIGMHILGNSPKYWANFAKLWAAYENVIYRFLYGEYVSPRSGILSQACPIAGEVIADLDRIDDRAQMKTSHYILKLMDKSHIRKRCINLTNISDLAPYKYDSVEDKNTIEFRSPNGTFDPVVWQNNVNLLVHLLMYAKSDRFDESLIKERIRKLIDGNVLFNTDRYMEVKDRTDISLDELFCYTNLSKYSYIYNEQAMELADLIFTNNLDKTYFLRQYIKSGLVSSKPFVRSAGFTRTRSLF